MTKRSMTLGTLVGVLTLCLPAVVFAQTDSSGMPDNSSPMIGMLVAWLLAAGGLISVIVGAGVDRQLRSGRR